jgi:uncharacterized membrane protein YeiB
MVNMESAAGVNSGIFFRPGDRAAQSRYASVDVARGLAILCMIIAHLTLVFHSPELFYYVGVLAAPFFLIIGGTSYDLLVSSRARKNVDRRMIRLEIYYRALLLVAIDTAVLFIGSMVWPSVFTFMLYWGVLQVLAFGYVFGTLIRNTLAAKVAGIAGLVLLVLAMDTFFSGNTTLSSLTTTLLPMLIYFQFGRVLFHLNNRNLRMRFANRIRALSLLSLAVVLAALFVTPGYDGILLNRMSLPSIAVICIVMFLVVLCLIRSVDDSGKAPVLLRPLERIGRMAFTIFYLHMVMIFAVIKIISLLLPNALHVDSLPLNVLAIALFVLALAEVERRWSRYGYRFSVEWVFREGARFLVAVTGRVVKNRQPDAAPE